MSKLERKTENTKALAIRLRTFIILISTALGVFGLISCSPTNGDDLSGHKLKLGVLPVADCLQAFVAYDQGYFSEAGLEVELVTLSGGSHVIEVVQSGDIQIGWSNIVSVAIAKENGIDLQFVSGGALETSANREHKLLIASTSSIQTIKELEGKVIAVNTLSNLPYLATIALLNEENVSLEKVTMIEVPFPQMEAAIIANNVDAALMIEPFVTSSLGAQTTKVLNHQPFAVFGEENLIAAWFSKESYIGSNENEIKAFQAAIENATQFIEEHPEDAKSILLKHTGLSSEILETVVLPRYGTELSLNTINPVLEIGVSYGVIQNVDVAEGLIK
jgi:NitT/TauT family transport system substrate-binding protein